MRLLTIQEAYKRKFERQKQISGLEYHAAGHCVHVGKISPGCANCFVPDPFRKNITSGAKCNLDCPYCFVKLEKEPDRLEQLALKAAILKDAARPDYKPISMSFSGGGEPLLYLDVIRYYMETFHEIEKDRGVRPWYYLYTNGVLADNDTLLQIRDLGIDEVRFHLGASNFSKKVYANMRKAVELFTAVSVETPAWPPHRDKLFEMLPIIEDVGVKHLNIGEIEITQQNTPKIAELLPEGEVYQCHEVHLYDGGLVYDIMEEVLRQDFSYSVIDCSCFVKNLQRSPAKYVWYEDVQGLAAEYF